MVIIYSNFIKYVSLDNKILESTPCNENYLKFRWKDYILVNRYKGNETKFDGLNNTNDQIKFSIYITCKAI